MYPYWSSQKLYVNRDVSYEYLPYRRHQAHIVHCWIPLHSRVLEHHGMATNIHHALEPCTDWILGSPQSGLGCQDPLKQRYFKKRSLTELG